MSETQRDDEGTIQHGSPIMRRFYGWMGMKSAHQRQRERSASGDHE